MVVFAVEVVYIYSIISCQFNNKTYSRTTAIIFSKSCKKLNERRETNRKKTIRALRFPPVFYVVQPKIQLHCFQMLFSGRKIGVDGIFENLLYYFGYQYLVTLFLMRKSAGYGEHCCFPSYCCTSRK